MDLSSFDPASNSIGVADGHGGDTQAHAFVEHADIVIEGIIGGGFDRLLIASTGFSQQPKIKRWRALGYSRDSGLRLSPTTLFLLPPYKQEILDYLVFQSVLSRSILQELKRICDPFGLEVSGRASAES